MRNNKAILDEAARSVRRTFIGSVAGSVGMLARGRRRRRLRHAGEI